MVFERRIQTLMRFSEEKPRRDSEAKKSLIFYIAML
jgi:hypothetical protein